MKKSILLILSLPLLLASCAIPYNAASSSNNNNSQSNNENQNSGGEQQENNTSGGSTNSGENTGESGGNNNTGGGTNTGGNTGESGGNNNTGEGTNTGGNTGESGGNNDNTGGNTNTGNDTAKTTTVTKAIVDLGFENAKNVNSFDLTSDLHVECSKGTNTQNAPKYYSADMTLRIYGGNTLTFTSSANIKKIVLQITSDSGDNGISVSTGTISSDRKTWTGSANSVVMTVLEKSGKICITSISATYEGTNEGGSGDNTGGNDDTGGGGNSQGGGTTQQEGQSGPNIQSGTGNTSSQYTVAWTGTQFDIAYSMFKGNLPCLKAFNGYATGDIDGSTIPYFNPYIKGWSKDSQTYYDLALKEMQYVMYDSEVVEGDDVIKYYRRGTYYVQTEHYRGDDNEYYFDVYAYNDYQAPFELDYDPAIELTTSVYNPKSGYKAFDKTINGIRFNSSNVTKDNDCIQLNKNSTMEITGKTFSKMDILFMKNANSCLVYAGTSSSNAKILYNDGGHFEFPSGTTYVKIQTLNSACAIECLSIL